MRITITSSRHSGIIGEIIMNFEGKTCGVCNKGKFKKVTHEVEKGVYVEAYKCAKCGEIAVSAQVMGKIEALRKRDALQRHIVQVGSSLAVPIPAILVKKLNLHAKGEVLVSESNGDLIIHTSLLKEYGPGIYSNLRRLTIRRAI
jgi:hypothetical protein